MNDKQRWSDDQCRCECKEIIDNGVCDKGFTWNPSNCKCKKKLVDKLIEECIENIDEIYLSMKMSVHVFTQFVLSWL